MSVLERAVADAIQTGLAEAERLRQRIVRAQESLERSARDLCPIVPCAACGQRNQIRGRTAGRTAVCGRCRTSLVAPRAEKEEAAASLLGEFPIWLDEQRREIGALFDRQVAALGHFNLALFGRTGAGKSSLIEAFCRGDGRSVSTGESDFTIEVRSVTWKGCRLYDTPGINGWGRTRTRGELEAHAEEAARIADVVLLAFDTQSQQASEFEKVARWVQAYGKPAIAVLNCRNPHWRLPPRVRRREERMRLSQSVWQHGGHIRDELSRIGLAGTPILAIHSKRALFARAREPFTGPDAASLGRQRAEHGAERLARWSNFPRLEDLLIEVLAGDATRLRLGMLRDELRSVLERLDGELAGHESGARQIGAEIESYVDGTLRVLGYPDPSARGYLGEEGHATGAGSDLLTRLEELRGEPFSTPALGQVDLHAQGLLTTKLAARRARAIRRAEEAIQQAYAEQRSLDGAALNREIFPDRAALEEDAAAVIRQSAEFLAGKLRVDLRDLQVDIECLHQELGGLDGDRGRGARRWGLALRVGGVLATLALGIGAVATGGLLAVGIGILSAIGSGLFHWRGKKSAARAEQERLGARAEARAQARRGIDEIFDRLEEDVRGKVRELTRQQGRAVLREPLRLAIGCRTLAAAASDARAALAQIRQELPARVSPSALLGRAQRELEARYFPGDPAAGRKLWLGEDWVDDPDGLLVSGPVPSAPAPAPLGAQAGPAVERDVLCARMVPPALPGAGAAWLAEVRRQTAGDEAAPPMLDHLDKVARSGRPRLFLCGDYNAGKTSFLRRLLLEAGAPLPSGLAVSGAPCTAEVDAYAWHDLLVVDTPGFQSGRPTDEQRALAALPEASLVLCLLQPNLLTGNLAPLLAVLRGDPAQGISAKLHRTLFLINRSDELGPDPAEAPLEYERLCRSKAAELLEALRLRQLEPDRAQLFCLASDPYGRVGDRADATAADFAASRTWDGFDAVTGVLHRLRALWGDAGADVAVLESGLARLAELRRARTEELADLGRRHEALQRLRGLVDEARAEARRLSDEIRGRAQLMIERYVEPKLDAALSRRSEEEILVHAKELETWWDRDDFHAEVAGWQKRAAEDIAGYSQRYDDAIQRRLRSREMRRAFPELRGPQFSAEEILPAKKKPNKVTRAAGKVGQGLQGTTRDMALRLGHAVGHRFAPWGAVKLAARLRLVGGALAVLCAGLDVWDIVRGRREEAQREEARQRAHRFVRESGDKVLSTLTEGHAQEGLGPGGHLRQCEEELGTLVADLEQQLAALVLARQQHEARVSCYERLMADARARLAVGPAGQET